MNVVKILCYNMKFDSKNKIRNVWSERNDLLIAYKENGKRKWKKIKDFPWYFVVKYHDFTHYPIFQNLIEEELIEKTERQGDWMKLYCRMEGGKTRSIAGTVINLLNEKGINLGVFKCMDSISGSMLKRIKNVKGNSVYDVYIFDKKI